MPVLLAYFTLILKGFKRIAAYYVARFLGVLLLAVPYLFNKIFLLIVYVLPPIYDIVYLVDIVPYLL